MTDTNIVAFTGPRFLSPHASPGTAMGVLGDRIIGFQRPEVWQEMGAEVVQLDGALVVPGLNDAHIHPLIAARDSVAIDVSPGAVKSRADLEAKLSAAVLRAAPGEWIRCHRYDPSGYPDGPGVLRNDLDRISPQNPVLIQHTAGHWGVTNSLGLKLGGYSEQADAPAGGFLDIDSDGELTGVLHEQAFFDYEDEAMSQLGHTVVPMPTESEMRQGMSGFLRKLNSFGITSVTDALCGPDGLALYGSMRAAGELSVRVNALMAVQHLDRFAATGIPSGFGDEWVRVGGFKAFVDGAVAGRTCLVTEPFEGSDDHGLQILTKNDLKELALRARRSRARLAVHANGDAAIRELVTAFAEDVDENGPAPMRHRIEHCSMPDDESIAKIAELGLIAVPFGSYAWYHGAKIIDWYGSERAERLFPHRSLLDAGVAVAGSSDYPCGPFEPQLGLMSCVLRQGQQGETVGGSQRISVEEAIELYTVGAAEASGESHYKGRLLPGMLADFAVFEDDLEALEPALLGEAQVNSTWVGGTCVWRRESDS